ncbi:MAG: N-6 DNA methylase [Erysipelotrichales bacterium]|nr:N-6 DNA methylase [Erysipelotrichales bacterium]
MKKYTIDDYIIDIDKYGLKKTWHSILSKTLNNKFISEIFNVDNYGELYEIGLEHVNKISKKEMGKYYTPRDVANVMSNWLKSLKGENVCDVGCGAGNLILSYLDTVGKGEAINLINNGKIYLFDLDEIALEICKYSIAIKYGKEYLKKIHAKKCDFLSKNVKLPKNSKVISNPPYYKIIEAGFDWKLTKVISDSKELYSAFIEKIINQSSASVIITPYSFIGSGKFYSLRKIMNKYNGYVVSFDNVPGNIFNGRKHGIFNSNKGNSVRAAITVVENKENKKGFRFSPLIRFKNEERIKMLNNEFLYGMVNDRYQLVDARRKAFYKCHSDLLDILDIWEQKSNKKMSKLLSANDGAELYLPTTCRYFTVGSKKNLSRDGKRVVRIKDKNKYNYVYCMMNSTFAYWYWRLYDGGINCPLTIINTIPVFFDIMNENQLKKLNKIAEEMQSKEKDYLVYKVNAGKKQENIKFPKKYRDEINKLFFEILNIHEDISILNKIHSSSLFEESESEDYE